MRNSTKEEAEFVGWYFGDGCISFNKNYKEFTITGDIKEELEFYQKIIIPYTKTKFNKRMKKPIELKRYKSTGVCGFYTFDKKLVTFISKKYKIKPGKKKDAEIPKWITNGNVDIKRAFVRGLFDTDGSIFFCRGNKKIYSILKYFHYKPKIKIATISRKNSV